jgi:hypothetical protein
MTSMHLQTSSHCLPPDSKPTASAPRGVFPACLDLHERHRHELSPEGIPRMSAGRHLSPSQSESADKLLGIRRRLAWLSTRSVAKV